MTLAEPFTGVQEPDDLPPAQRARREALLVAALGLLSKRDYEAIHIREIAAAAGVALATLYRYFPSKEQLYANAVLAWAEPFARRVKDRCDPIATDPERLKVAVRLSMHAYERSPHAYRVTASLALCADARARALMQGVDAAYRRTLASVLLDTADEDAALIAETVVGVAGVLLRYWSLGQLPFSRVCHDLDRTIDLIFGQPARKKDREFSNSNTIPPTPLTKTDDDG